MSEAWTGDPLSWRIGRPTAVTIGVFDGVHRGHRAVLGDVVGRARSRDLVPVALTFDPHPLEFLEPDRAPKLLGSIEQRIELLWTCGVDVVGVLPFPEIRDLAPDVFANEVLADRLSARLVAVGSDFRFGRDRKGDIELLVTAGRAAGFEVQTVSLVEAADGEVVSSSRIRGLLASGELDDANRLLGRRFELRGPVIHGDGRGRQIGFPTANLHIPDRLAVPAYGVYAVWATWEGREAPAVVNIGVRPTFGENRRMVEAHLIDFDEDLYGIDLSLRFVRRLRDERRFDSVDALVLQITVDRAEAAAALAEDR